MVTLDNLSVKRIRDEADMKNKFGKPNDKSNISLKFDI